MKNSFIIFFLFISFKLFAQPFQVGHTTITFIDSSRSNKSIETEIYYPADVAGNNVPFTAANNFKFPVLGFGHGFVMTWDAYENIWNATVPEGFIIGFPKTEGGFSPSHLEFGKDIAFILSQISTLGNNSASLFYNRVDTMNCAMGHSMGGGAAFLAVQYNPGIKALATLASAETNPSAIQAASNISVPSLLFAGGNDCITPPSTNQIAMYDNLPTLCKTFVSITGGSHCQMANSNFFCNIGESTCSPQPSISRADQQLVINKYLLPWLKYELKADCNAGNQFDSLLAMDNAISYMTNCSLCSTTSIHHQYTDTRVDVYPNPFTNEINIDISANDSAEIMLYDSSSKQILQQSFTGHYTINAQHIAKGIYIYKVNSKSRTLISSGKLVKQ